MNSDFDTHLPERQQALRAKCFHATGTHIPFPHDAVEGSLVDRFEECVRHHTERIAVRTRRYRLTYGELDALANRIAHAILARSSATDKPVALLLGHDALVIAAMLGALKAGKPYVPLDPAYPRHRLEFMLRDSTSELLLTEGRHLADGRALAGDEIQVLDIESIDAPSDHVESVTGPRAAAFIVYTSGSTGQPKGIVQNHAMSSTT